MRTSTTLGTITIALLALVGLGACEKDSGLPAKTSGKLRSHERALLDHLPGGNVALFGGNYMRLQGFFQKGPMARLMGQAEAMAPGLMAWTECFLEGDAAKLQILGAVAYRDGVATMTFAMKGFTVPQVEACARKASFPTTVDADGMFIAIEMPNPLGAYTTGYLALADGALLSRQAMPFGSGEVRPTGSTRADLEATVAAAARGSASDDAELVAEAGRIDRDRAVWFAADLSTTPAADKVGLVRGWIDIAGGLDLDVNVQVIDREIADEIARGIPKLKDQAGALGKDVAAVVRGLRYQRTGDRFRVGLKISDAQFEALMQSMGGALGGGGL